MVKRIIFVQWLLGEQFFCFYYDDLIISEGWLWVVAFKLAFFFYCTKYTIHGCLYICVTCMLHFQSCCHIFIQSFAPFSWVEIQFFIYERKMRMKKPCRAEKPQTRSVCLTVVFICVFVYVLREIERNEHKRIQFEIWISHWYSMRISFLRKKN